MPKARAVAASASDRLWVAESASDRLWDAKSASDRLSVANGEGAFVISLKMALRPWATASWSTTATGRRMSADGSTGSETSHAIDIAFSYVDRAAKAGDEQARAQLLPRKQTAHSAGFDLVAAVEETITIRPGQRRLIPSGVAIALPIGYEAQIRPRSGLALKHGLTCLNTPGTIDADYRGEIGILLIHHGDEPFEIERGMRVAQLVIAQVTPATFVEANLGTTERGANGFGSTGDRNVGAVAPTDSDSTQFTGPKLVTSSPTETTG